MVILDDALHREAKLLALKRGQTLSELMAEALHIRLMTSAPATASFRPLPVCPAKGGLRPGVDLDDMKSVYAALEEGVPLDKLK